MGQCSQGRPAHTAAQRLKIDKLIGELFCGDDNQAEQAALQLGRVNVNAVALLQPYLRAAQSDQRWWATRALAEVQHPQVIPLLILMLNDPELSVRQCAALGLTRHPSPLAVPALIQALDSSDSLLRRLASQALIAAGAAAVSPLLELMEKGKPNARLEAARALASIGDEQSISALYTALNEDSAILEYWASEGLDRMGVGMVYFYPD